MLVSAGILPHSPLYLPLRPELVSDFKIISQATDKFTAHLATSVPDIILVMYQTGSSALPVLSLNNAPNITLTFPSLTEETEVATFKIDPCLTYRLRQAVETKVPSIMNHDFKMTDHGLLAALPLAKIEARFIFVGISEALSFDDLLIVGKIWREIIEQSRLRVSVIMGAVLSQTLMPDSPAGYSPVGAEFDSLFRNLWLSGDLTPLHQQSPDSLKAAHSTVIAPSWIFSGLMSDHFRQAKIEAYSDTFGVGYLVASWL